MAAVAAHYRDFLRLGAYPLAISTDSVYSHKVFAEVSPSAATVQYPLLSDRSGAIGRSYGVWDPKTGAFYRSTFIIDPLGRVRYYSVYPREVGRSVEEILRTLAGIQYGELTGEGAPAGWQPGMPGLKRDFSKAGTI
ncbi:peroxiredoxin [Anaerosporomusa subterranea]|uniref:Peroxiredoxin n=1 Tax=Anaerosporomusa subterranea TaxID=1794912 RepID=A0A154BNH1_ANASB|nr:peroxiredoxin [Anaerosporomusa subterranea]